ncbi:MAG: hypothetical protein HF978_18520 [Desulfobacteraceae bacterium]|nr:hypothetical protein [Desulfobacteraceae bacterium]MBC2757543.1 hypothetical protein [Desulfobacteraceae bacterium]
MNDQEINFLNRQPTFRTSKFFFDKRDHRLLGIVNDMISGDTSTLNDQRRFFHYFHPRGIKEMAESKGLRIAYAVIHLLASLERGQIENRLNALRALSDEVLCSADQGLKKNTARVLLEIMKELVRAHGNYARQLELARDFSIVASGKPRIVRDYLERYHLLEMPEEWNQLAFDDHVHDANTKGRKSATHLIMDAWIKGIRRLRVIYYNYIRPETAAELMEAAVTMGIMVRIGIEFSASFYAGFAQIIWVPRGFTDSRDFLRFLEEEPVRAFMNNGRAVSDHQQDYVVAIFDAFNEHHRLTINRELEINLPMLNSESFYKFVGMGQASMLHLAKFIHERLLPLLTENVSRLRKRYAQADVNEQERIEALVVKMNLMTVDTVHERFLKPEQNPSVPDITKSCTITPIPLLMQLSPCGIIDRLADFHSGYRITLNLTNLKVEDVLEMLYNCNGRITRLEIFNLKDYSDCKVDHIPAIHRLQQSLNDGNVIQIKQMILEIIDRMKIKGDPIARSRVPKFKKILADIETLKNMYQAKPLKPRVGSDSTGHIDRLFGMGLVVMDSLPDHVQKKIKNESGSSRLIIPFYIDTSLHRIYSFAHEIKGRLGQFLTAVRKIPGLRYAGIRCRHEWVVHEDSTRMVDHGNIVTMGGHQGDNTNQLTLVPTDTESEKGRFSWRYVHPVLQNIIKVGVGFAPAFLTFLLTHDWWVLTYFGAFIWFSITGLRNIVQSVIGGGGIRRSSLLKWNDFVSWDRLSDSLFYTGFSVPLLDYLVKTLLLQRELGITTSTSPVLLYAIMALVNGVYLTSHNLFRGLPKEAAYGNFFRSVLSIPVAFTFNAMIGGLLGLFGAVNVAGILQSWAAVISKAASDCVAGFIEGSVDRTKNVKNRLKDYRQKLNQFLDCYARLEILFPETDVYDLLDQPKEWLAEANQDARDQIMVLIINALDLLYLWMYQPRARTAFSNLLCRMELDERRILIKAQSVLRMEREISQMFIDGIAGRNFSKPLAFYLNRSKEYLKAIDKLDSCV